MTAENKYGKFSKDGLEYIINTADTPRPWVNYLTNGQYAALCSQTGGGFSFYKDHRFNQVLRRDMRQHLTDMPGRLIYIKDEETGEVWTANVYPSGKFDSYEARQGLGYTTINSQYNSINSTVKYFVPREIDSEMWRVRIDNKDSKPRKLSVYAFADFVLGNVMYEEGESRFMTLFNDSVIEEQSMLLIQKWWKTQFGPTEDDMIWEWIYRVFMVSTAKPSKMLTSRDDFLGKFRNYSNPEAVEADLLPDTLLSGRDLAGVFQWKIELQPGQAWETDLAIGIQGVEENAENRKLIND